MRNDFYDIRDLLLQKFDQSIVDTVLNAKSYFRVYGETNSPLSKKDKVDIDFCKFLYDGRKLPCYKLAMLYGVSDGTMRTYLISKGASMTGHCIGKNSENDYFEKIDSFDKAYFLGLILADGNIMSKEWRMQISLSEQDDYILKKFNEYANFKTTLYKSHCESPKPRMALSVHSKKLVSDLMKHGVKDRKSINGTFIPSSIPDHLVHHFIRGYFDGDGIAKSNGYIGFCGDATLLRQIKGFFMYRLKVNDNAITFNQGNNISYIQWAKKEDRENIARLIYENKQDLYLVRKYEKIYRPFIQ